MANKQSDVLEPRFDGGLIHNKYVKAGLFIVKTLEQRNSTIKSLYRETNGDTTTLCYVSAQNAIYELLTDPPTGGTTNSDWKKLDFGVSDILVAKGTWDADNTTPVLTDADAQQSGNDFYVVTGAVTPILVQYTNPPLFGGQEVTVKDGDWIISNGTEFFVSGAPLNWDSISGKPQTLDDYVAGTVIGHQHDIDGANGVIGLQAALDLKYDVSNVGDHGIAWGSVPDDKLVDVFLVKQNYFDKSESYSQTEVDAIASALNPLTTKGDLMSHNGTTFTRHAVGVDGQIIIADAAEASGWKWGAAAETGWKTVGETILSGAATINQNNSLLTFKTGELSVSGFEIYGTLDVDIDVNLFRFNHPASSGSGDARTEVYLGAGNGNQASEAWGNVMIGQNNATSLLATGEWDGGFNVMIGRGIAPQFATVGAGMATHNILLGRKALDGSGSNISYTIGLGYEVGSNVTSTQAGLFQQTIMMGIWAYEGVSLDAAVDDLVSNHDIIAIGTSALRDATVMYNAGNVGSERGGHVSAIALGTSALRNATVERYNIAIGDSALKNAITGRGNIAIGVLAGSNVIGGTAGNTGTGTTLYNVMIGLSAGAGLSGDRNAFMGADAGSTTVLGDFNAGYGASSLNRVTGNYNAALGAYAGYNATASLLGVYNAFIGAGATYDASSPTFSNSILIATDYTQLMESNKIYIGSPTQNVILNGALTENLTETQVAVINSTTGEIEYRPSSTIAAVPVGNDGDIQFKTGAVLDANAALNFSSDTLFVPKLEVANNDIYTPDGAFLFDHSKRMIVAANDPSEPHDWTLAHAQSGYWSAIFGEKHIFLGGRAVNLLISGWYHTIGDTATGGVFSGAGAFVTGGYNHAGSQFTQAQGYGVKALGYASIAMGAGYDHGSTGQMGDSAQDAWLVAGGVKSFNVSSIDGNHVIGEGAYGNFSAILGGLNHDIPTTSDRSAILGGNRILAPAGVVDTVFFPKVRLGLGTGGALPTTGETHSLGYDDATGEIIKTALGGGGGGWPLAGDATLTAEAKILSANSVGVIYDATGFYYGLEAIALSAAVLGGSSAVPVSNVVVTTNNIVIGYTSDETDNAGVNIYKDNITFSLLNTEVSSQRSISVTYRANSTQANLNTNVATFTDIVTYNITTSSGSAQTYFNLKISNVDKVTTYVTGINTRNYYNDTTYGVLFANGGIGGVITAGAILDLKSTTSAFIPPRMTEAQRNLIPSASIGMMVYNTTTNALNMRDNSAWGEVGGGGGWAVTGTTTLTGDVVIDATGTYNLRFTNLGEQGLSFVHFDGDGAGDQLYFRSETATQWAYQIINGESGFVESRISDGGWMTISNAGTNGEIEIYLPSLVEFKLDDNALKFSDLRTAGNQEGLIYGGDYTDDFVARSLIDKGFADTNYMAQDTTQKISTVHLQLSQAQIDALNATPIVLVAAPAAGKYIQILGGSAKLNHVTTAFTGGDVIQLQINGASLFETNASFVTAGADNVDLMRVVASGTPIAEATALEVGINSDAAGGGTSTIDVYVQYAIIDTN